MIRALIACGLVLVVPPGLFRASEALANGSCGTSSIYFDGPYSTQLGVWGERAWLTTRQAPFCTGSGYPSNLITAFSMMQANPAKFNGYAQSGYMEIQGTYSSMQYFAEYKKDNTTPFVRVIGPTGTGLGSTPTTGSNHEYSAGYDGSFNDIRIYVDNSEILDSNFNPYGYWPGPWGPQWTGETHDTGDNVPGTSTAHASFTYMGVQTQCWGCAFSTPSGLSLFNNNANCYAGAYGSTDESAFDIWEYSGC